MASVTLCVSSLKYVHNGTVSDYLTSLVRLSFQGSLKTLELQQEKPGSMNN